MHKYLAIDVKKCTGCRLCEMWCSFKNSGFPGPAYSRVRVYAMDEKGVSVPLMCNHCEEAFCMKVCPTKSLKRDEATGAVTKDYNLCIGCRACILACPFGAVFLDPDGKVIKCDLCNGKAGGPTCAARCPRGAITYQKPELLALAKQKEHFHKLVDTVNKPS